MPKKPIRQIRIEGQVAYVPLTRGYEAIIDAADVPSVDQWNWQATQQQHTIYAVRTERSGTSKRTVRMHRALMGDPIGFEVDHVDGNGLDNRRSNLRQATPSQNQFNQRLSSANSSGFKGVTWCRKGRRWKARIKVKNVLKHLGTFTSPEAAHAAYCAASERFHGDFGRTD